MQSQNPPENPAAVVKALEQKVDEQYRDRPERDQQPTESAEDADPGAADTAANTVEPPD